MLSKLWFRFGIPLGSATVLAALLDLALALYWFLNDIGSVLYFHIWDHNEPTDYRTYLGLTAVCSKVFLTICLWVFVLLGQRAILLFWIPFSIIADLLFLGHAINNCTHFTFVSDEIWFLNLTSVVLLRFYITCVIYQTFRRLLQNAKAEISIKEQRTRTLQLTPMTNGDTNANTNGAADTTIPVPVNHFGNLSRKSNVDMPLAQDSPRFLLIEPIGETPGKIFEFFNETPRLGGAVLVIFELIWNCFTLSTHSLTEFMLGGRIFFMPQEEEIFMRIWRIVVDIAAIILIFKRRKTLLRFWLIVYFWTLFASLCIFVYVIADWFEPPSIVVILVITNFLGDNLLRFGVLYFCLRITTLPPPSPTAGGTEVARSHSLRSQYRPRSKRSRTRKKFDELHAPPPVELI